MIVDSLSNAAYRVSLHGSGVELEGGISMTPPSGRGQFRHPTGRYFEATLYHHFLTMLYTTLRFKNKTHNIISPEGIQTINNWFQSGKLLSQP